MDVLVVDPEVDRADRVRSLFETRGHRVAVRETGARGLAAVTVARGGLSIIVAARDLSDMSGLELTLCLRRVGRYVPVLILGGGGAKELADILAGGADDYVAADALDDGLVARAQALHRRSTVPATRHLIDIGGLVVDAGAHVVAVDGKSVALSGAELRVLVALGAAARRVVTREQLTSACWGDGAIASANALESVVKRLRRKLGEAHGSRVRSVRLCGYVLVDSE